jgi:hypothetical protein
MGVQAMVLQPINRGGSGNLDDLFFDYVAAKFQALSFAEVLFADVRSGIQWDD